MRFIVNNKLYDTDKAELLCSFRKQWESKTVFGTRYPYRDTDLYKTVKGSFFLTGKGDYEQYIIEVIDEEKAKKYLMYHHYEKYMEMYGALEEA